MFGKHYIYVFYFLFVLSIGIQPWWPGSIQGADDPFLGVSQTPHNLSLSSSMNPCLACHIEGPPNQVKEKRKVEDGGNPLWVKNNFSHFTPFSTKISLSPEKIEKRPNGASFDCLSCHDGVVAMDAHKMGIREEGASDLNWLLGGFFEPIGGTGDREFQFLDHPVSISYPRNSDGQFVGTETTVTQLRYWSIPNRTSNGIDLPTGPRSKYLVVTPERENSSSMLVRTTAGLVECDSCHNPHNNDKSAFLRESGHTLCLICHNR
ncbi:MAG TPA: cytochrome c3 family protein [Nitrospiria bacterium]